MKRISALIVDDEELARKNLEFLLRMIVLVLMS